jgi:hypothetical protein
MTVLASRSILYPDELIPPRGLRGAALDLWRAATGWAARAVDLHARILGGYGGCGSAEAERMADLLHDRLVSRRAALDAADEALAVIRGARLFPFAGVYHASACHAARAYADDVHGILRAAARVESNGPTPGGRRARADWEGGIRRAAGVLRGRLPAPQNLGVRGLLAGIRAEAVKYQAVARGGAGT